MANSTFQAYIRLLKNLSPPPDLGSGPTLKDFAGEIGYSAKYHRMILTTVIFFSMQQDMCQLLEVLLTLVSPYFPSGKGTMS